MPGPVSVAAVARVLVCARSLVSGTFNDRACFLSMEQEARLTLISVTLWLCVLRVHRPVFNLKWLPVKVCEAI
jgi:hypothetical protein